MSEQTRRPSVCLQAQFSALADIIYEVSFAIGRALHGRRDGFCHPALSAEKAQDFVNKAAEGGIFEVESSKIIQGKAKDQAVNDFAQKMITDHGAANAKLHSTAPLGVNLKLLTTK